MYSARNISVTVNVRILEFMTTVADQRSTEDSRGMYGWETSVQRWHVMPRGPPGKDEVEPHATDLQASELQ